MDDLMKKMTYGYYVVTALKAGDEMKTRDEDYVVAGTINWAMQTSFTPPMLAVAVGQKSHLNETIDYSGHFTLHLLGKEHKSLIEKFAKDSTVKDGKINGVTFEKKNGEIILEKSLGYCTCKVIKSENIGDHTVHFGEIIKSEALHTGDAICTMELPSTYTKDNLTQ